MPTAFVTGATGFVGGAVARALLDEGWHVRVLARAESDARNLEHLERLATSPPEAGAASVERHGSVERHVGDLRDPESLESGLRGCDVLFHVAARYSLWNPRPREIYRDNVDGTRHLLEAAGRRGVEKIVYTSTVGTIHIDGDGTPGSEERLYDLDEVKGHYKRSKWLAEQEVRRLARDGLPVTIVHPSAPVGPFDVKPTPTGQMVVDYLDHKAKAYADTGLNIVDVDDVARGHLLAAERGERGEGYILGGEDLSLLDIYRVLGDVTDIPSPRVRVPHGALTAISLVGEVVARVTRRPPLVPWEAVAMASKRMYFDTSKARGALGFESRPARTALERATLWFYRNGYARRPARAGVVERLVERVGEREECSPESIVE